MAKKSNTKTKKTVSKTSAKSKKGANSSNHKNGIMCDDEIWHKAAWLVIFGIALGICIGYALFSPEV